MVVVVVGRAGGLLSVLPADVRLVVDGVGFVADEGEGFEVVGRVALVTGRFGGAPDFGGVVFFASPAVASGFASLAEASGALEAAEAPVGASSVSAILCLGCVIALAEKSCRNSIGGEVKSDSLSTLLFSSVSLRDSPLQVS